MGGLAQGGVQEADDLAAVAGLVGGELGGGGAAGDLVLHGPQHGLGVILAVLHVREGAGLGLGLRLAAGDPEEGHGLGPGDGLVGAEAGGGAAAGDLVGLVGVGPVDGLMLRGAVFRHIREKGRDTRKHEGLSEENLRIHDDGGLERG